MNPVRKLRLKNGYNTINELAIALGRDYNSIFRAEAGMMLNLSDSLLDSLGRVFGCNPEEIAEEYREWRESKKVSESGDSENGENLNEEVAGNE